MRELSIPELCVEVPTVHHKVTTSVNQVRFRLYVCGMQTTHRNHMPRDETYPLNHSHIPVQFKEGMYDVSKKKHAALIVPEYYSLENVYTW